ncbi:HlyD family secretion protein [Empedobacter brevis]
MRGLHVYTSIVVLFLLVFCSLPFIKVPISATSYGIVNDLKNNNPIISMVEGKIIKSNVIRNNQFFKKGDTIIEINTDQLEEYNQFQNTQYTDFSSQLKDLISLSKGVLNNLNTGVYQKQVSAYREKIAQIESELNLATRDFERVKKLFDAGIYTQAEYDKNSFKVENLKRQIGNIKQEQIATWQIEKRELERIIRENRKEVNTTNKKLDNYIIKSPDDGRLINYSGIQVGNYITTGTQVGIISPESTLVIEARVSPKDIGFIKKGQSIKVQVDTYNYNQWGLLSGKVIEIQKNITDDEKTNEPYFIVFCSMDKKFLKLKNGYKANIEKGMTVNVRFYLLDRTIWQLLFDNVDDWFNPNLGK